MTSDYEKYHKKYYENNKEKILAENKEIAQQMKREILLHYGMVCACCGIEDIRFLTIDHIDGRKKWKHSHKLRGTRFYKWLKENDFPKGFQTLCFNCNTTKGYYGECPHKTPLLTVN